MYAKYCTIFVWNSKIRPRPVLFSWFYNTTFIKYCWGEPVIPIEIYIKLENILCITASTKLHLQYPHPVHSFVNQYINILWSIYTTLESKLEERLCYWKRVNQSLGESLCCVCYRGWDASVVFRTRLFECDIISSSLLHLINLIK